MHNPYQTPLADLDTARAEEIDTPPEVGGFWIRVGAQILDVIFLSPVIGLTFWLSSMSRYFYAIWLIPGTMLGMFLTVYLVRRYGGSPGKLVLKLRVQMQDGAPVSTKAAWLRVAPVLALSLATNIGSAYAAMNLDQATYFSFGFMQRAAAIAALSPGWASLGQTLMQVWMLAGAVAMLRNKRRRALHDFLAGTVVVKAKRDI